MTILHLITQRGQPYGSYRYCCERCGDMHVEGMKYTERESVYNTPHDGYVTCRDASRKDDSR